MSGSPYVPALQPPGRKRLSRKMQWFGGTSAALVLGAGVYAMMAKHSVPREAAPPPSTGGFGVVMTLPDPIPRFPLPAPEVIPVVSRVAPPPVAPPPTPAAAPGAVKPPPVTRFGFWEDSNAGQAAAPSATRVTASTSTASTLGRSDPDVATPGPSGSGKSDYGERMKSTHFSDAEPTPHHFHVAYTIKKGTTFRCTPASPISSELPGPVQCTTDDDVWSMDGSTILLPRGTQVNGAVEHGLSNGEQRLFLIWTDALTPRPDLLAIPLDAPAADEMGQTGVPGDINDHLWKKLKATLLVSMIDIAESAVSGLARQGNGNQTFNLGNSGQQVSSLGQLAFGHDLNIPSTLYRGPGQPLTVYVNKYIDLHKFYLNVAAP